MDRAHFLQTETEPRLVSRDFRYENAFLLNKLTKRQFYKPWETSPEEDERIRNQISEARETIKRETEEHQARHLQENQRDWHNPAYVGGDTSYVGKTYTSNASREPSTHSRTNNSAISPADLEMKDRNTEDQEKGAEGMDLTAQDTQNSINQGHETPAGQLSKDNADENGEDVVEEAAEDTVIY